MLGLHMRCIIPVWYRMMGPADLRGSEKIIEVVDRGMKPSLFHVQFWVKMLEIELSRKITGRCKVLIPANYVQMCDSSIEAQNRDGISRDVMKKTGTRTEGLRVDSFRLLLAPF
ncbi:hypothetical protein ANTQUA_LOCUS4164 [Anthophora quadrimaculata]